MYNVLFCEKICQSKKKANSMGELARSFSIRKQKIRKYFELVLVEVRFI